jgi:hypothetical protein
MYDSRLFPEQVVAAMDTTPQGMGQVVALLFFCFTFNFSFVFPGRMVDYPHIPG